MKSSVYYFLALVAVTAARQLNSGPQIFSEPQSSISGQPQKTDKRYAPAEYTIYLSPKDIKSFGSGNEDFSSKYPIQSVDKFQQSNEQNYNDKLYSEYARLSEPVEESQEGNKEQSQNAFYFDGKPIYEDQENNFNIGKTYLEQSLGENQQIKIENQENEYQKQYKLIPYKVESRHNQDDSYLNEQLQQQWNRILDHNRAQLKAIKTTPNKDIENLSQNEKPTIVYPKSEKDEQQKSEIEKEIEYILKNAGHLGLPVQDGFTEDEINYQRPPIVINKEVSITKHQPVHVIRKVKVPVPKPVFVPVPEPNYVKVPHPYPVPVEIVKKIPVHVLRHY